MKKILGLDLGTNSIGWAVVNEAEKAGEKSSIVKLGVRTISFDNFVSTETGKSCMDAVADFKGGKGISSNAGRRGARSMRRNLQRYKLRREHLRKILKEHGFIDDATILSEKGNATTFETYRLRAKAASSEVSLVELARVLLMINKKRGYKSNRKAKSKDEEGSLINGMDVAKKLYDENLTPGALVLSYYEKGKRPELEFYPSDLQAEFDKIWNFQGNFYPDRLTAELKLKLCGKNKSQTWAICKEPFGLVGMKRTTKGFEQQKEDYVWRVRALSEKLGLEELAIVLQNINGQISGTSGYLGSIGDRSKELYFNHLTVGEFQMGELVKNPNHSLRNQVFYRQDYLDEFEKIWETQATFHPELTPELKREIRDVVIFYQRPLKSKKGSIAVCELEGRTLTTEILGKKKTRGIGPKVAPRSSPIYNEFRIWQVLNNLELTSKEDGECKPLSMEAKKALFAELNIREKLSKEEALRILFGKESRNYDLNFEKLEGNRTQQKLFEKYQKIIEMNGLGEFKFSKLDVSEVLKIVRESFEKLGFKTDFLTFDSSLSGKDFELQPLYRLWHLLYSFEGDKTATGNGNLILKIQELCGMDRESAAILSAVTFEDDYGSLSVKAIKKILPFLKEGKMYSEACEMAGYKHSKRSLTREELSKKVYKAHLEPIPLNTLRNPVVEKILNQMVNVVNALIDCYGKPDEVRIELARELKKSNQERKEMADAIKQSTAEYEGFRKVLETEFGLAHPSKNDLLRYRLYLELAPNGYKTLYSDTYISKEKLFSKEFDIEHIIPQAKRFDDSFANKTLEVRQINLEKSNLTAFDFVKAKYGEQGLEDYRKRIETCKLGKAKVKNLLTTEKDIPEGFINRDLRDTQYIAKKAREMLEEIVPFVVPTTGSVTDRLREDWQLVNVMQELNWDKYNRQNLTETYQDKDGRTVKRIKDWTKRNDHRHHAMDALTIAFTKRSFIQYLNNLNARVRKGAEEVIDLANYDLSNVAPKDVKRIEAAIEAKELYRNDKGKLCFIPPLPLDEFRAEAKKQLENVLISIKARNKVVTKNWNRTKKRDGENAQPTLTPRGQLHNESIYGKSLEEVVAEEKIGAKFTVEKIATVCSEKIRAALIARLQAFGGDPKKAFTGANALAKNPIYMDAMHAQNVPETVQTKVFRPIFTIRKKISADLKVEKVIDAKVREILQARLAEYGNDAKKAFENLEENPIWLNREKGIAIKSVKIRAVSNAIPLRNDHDFVQTSNNHHIAIFRDANGDLQENVVSFYDATQRAIHGLPIVDKDYKKDEGWEFLFTMKRNEFFVFPNAETGFDPKQVDLLDPQNYAQISPNLFRVQYLSKVEYGNQVVRDYKFRHHLETSVKDEKKLRDVTYRQYKTLKFAEDIVKVRVNHIGQIVSVGEY